VVVQLNGEDIAEIAANASGQPVLVPTAPGDEITVVSLRGEYLEASSGTASVRTRALSRTENTVSVEPKERRHRRRRPRTSQRR
jgi:hypothetical protein